MSSKKQGDDRYYMKMLFSDFVRKTQFILTEGAIIERIRRSDQSLIDPILLNSPLVYTDTGRKLLSDLHRQYVDIGMKHDLPMLIFTDTWRANKERLETTGMADNNVNGDCAAFLRDIVRDYGLYGKKIYIGGLIGCKSDAYKPKDALSEREASAFHAFQIDALAAAGVDFLFAATIPSLSEATGMAKAMARTGIFYVISFVLSSKGLILDGTSLREAINAIDSMVSPAPLFYMANCCHPTFYEAAMRRLMEEDASLLNRVIGLQANTSSRNTEDLDNLLYLDSEAPDTFAESMLILHRDFGTKILGGCCGSDDRHITAIAERLTGQRTKNDPG